MYSINGVPLHSDSWSLLDASTTVAGTTVVAPELNAPGFDGVLGYAEMDGIETVPAITLVVGLRRSTLDAFRLLMQSDVLTLTDARGFDGYVQLSMIEPVQVGVGEDPEWEVRVQLRLVSLWLSGVEETAVTALDAATKTVNLFTGQTGKTSDALVRLTDCTDPKVTDSRGSWFRYEGVIAAGSYLRFDALRHRAWLTASDTWTGGTEVTAAITTGPGPYALRLTPHLAADLSSKVRLTVTTAARGASAAIAVRGRPAYTL